MSLHDPMKVQQSGNERLPSSAGPSFLFKLESFPTLLEADAVDDSAIPALFTGPYLVESCWDSPSLGTLPNGSASS